MFSCLVLIMRLKGMCNYFDDKIKMKGKYVDI